MKLQSYVALAPFLLFANVSYAQNSILAGQITDENGKPVPNALVSITGEKSEVKKEDTSDANGLYNISPLPAGTYEVVIVENNHRHVLRRLAPGAGGEYYNFVVGPKKMNVVCSKEDPFLKAKLQSVRQQQWGMDVPVSRHGNYIINYETGGRVRNVQYGERVPQSR